MESLFQAELSPRQQEAITALVAQPTVQAAASAVGVASMTIWRWLRDERFRAAYDEAHRLVAAHAAAALQIVGQQALAGCSTSSTTSRAPTGRGCGRRRSSSTEA